MSEIRENFDNDIESALKKLVKNYDLYVKNLETYPFNSDSMCQEFVDLFTELTDKEIISKKEPISKFSSFAFRSRQKLLDVYYFSIKDRIKNILGYFKKNFCIFKGF